MNRSIVRRTAIYVAALATASAMTGVLAAPAMAQEEPASTAPSTSEPPPPSSSTTPTSTAPSSSAPESKPVAKAERAHVDVSVAFDKPSYGTDEDVTFTFKLKNVGETRAAGLTIFQIISKPTDLDVPYDGWGALKAKPGLTLEPGETFDLKVAGKVRSLASDSTVVEGVLFDESGNSASDSFTFSVPVTKVAGRAVGTVYGDKNGNGAFDDGEQLADAKLTLRYVHSTDSTTYTATSGADGKFAFADLPAAEYYLGGDIADGWLIPWETVRIGPDTKDLFVREVPPLNDALKATMAFAQDTYRPGDLAHVNVTLSNSGSIPLTGIVAACDRFGAAYALKGNGPGWGDLAWTRAGVTIAPGQTRTFDVTETVPQGAFTRGFVSASCDFGYREVDVDHHATAGAKAAVPGAKLVVEGNIGVFDNQNQVKQGVGGIKVVLVSDQHCPVTGEQTTDAKGHFAFKDVTPGPDYRLYFLPPKGWKISYENPMEIWIFGPPENPTPLRIEAEQGDGPAPAVPTNPADCTATPPTSTTGAAGGTGGGESGGSGLASTGVEVFGLGVLALAALGLGGALVIGARRRRHAA